MTIDEILEQVNDEIIINIMEENGSPVYSKGTTSNGEEYMTFKTICHHGDSHKLYYYSNSKTFYCYTNCGSMSVFDLVKKVCGYTEFSEALRYVANQCGINLGGERRGIQDSASVINVRNELSQIDQILESRNNKVSIQNITKFYDDKILNYFDYDAFYQGWIDEGITEESMQKYKISFYWLEGHIIIPHYDQQGRLVGIRRRSLNPEDAKNKYMPEYICGKFYEHPLGLNLYGLYQNQNAIKHKKKAIIVEGEKSVLLADSYYGDNSTAVATCGFNVSDWQIKALKQLGVSTVYLGFDKDYDITLESEYRQNKQTWENYKHYRDRLQALALRLSMFFTTYILFDRDGDLQIKDSPMDKGLEVLEKLINNAKLIKMG